MTTEQINNRYIELCKKYDVALHISHIKSTDAPRYEMSMNEDVHTVILNDAKIENSMYEPYWPMLFQKYFSPAWC